MTNLNWMQIITYEWLQKQGYLKLWFFLILAGSTSLWTLENIIRANWFHSVSFFIYIGQVFACKWLFSAQQRRWMNCTQHSQRHMYLTMSVCHFIISALQKLARWVIIFHLMEKVQCLQQLQQRKHIASQRNKSIIWIQIKPWLQKKSPKEACLM